MRTFILPVRGPFSLAASTRFLEGFAPAAFDRAADQPLELAFPVDGNWQTAGVRVHEHADGVEVQIVSPAAPGQELLKAAAWAIIGARIRIRQAAAIKDRMARELGESVSFGGWVLPAFPAPRRLASLEGFPGLAGRKPEWLRSLAVAALDGRLDAARLRALPAAQALAQLRELPGIGEFSAELVLLRGAGAPDEVPRHESRLGRAVALAYDLPGPPSADELARISGTWRPYRTWTTLLLRTYLEDETGEIGGQRPSGEKGPAGRERLDGGVGSEEGV